MRYIGRWQELETQMVSESTTKVIYEATTPGFSVFAISVKTAVAKEEQKVVEETKPAVIEELVKEQEKSSSWLLITMIFLALVLVGVIFYFNKGKFLSKDKK